MHHPEYEILVRSINGNAELRRVFEVKEWRVEQQLGSDCMIISVVTTADAVQSFVLDKTDAQDIADVLARKTAPASMERRAQSDLVAAQTERRERAERATAVAQAAVTGLQQDLEHVLRHTLALNNELNAAEAQLREMSGTEGENPSSLGEQLRGRRILYVGGRPSSTPAIRTLVEHYGGHFQKHDGGLETRKSHLASAVAAADLVVFPLDCSDHDCASNLRRLCMRQNIAFVPMRRASVASFVAAVSNHPDGTGPGRCLRS